MLSLRTMHCTPYEIMFECASSRLCECSFSLEDAAPHKHFVDVNWKSVFSNPHVSIGTWRKMISLYSRKELTDPKDLLPALSSIANRCVGLGRYHGGMWEIGFAGSLLWYSVSGTFSGKAMSPLRRKFWMAPSFSWPSRSGPKAFLDLENATSMIQCMTVTTISMTPDGHNPLGNLKWGSNIEVTGRIIYNASFVNMFERPMPSRTFMKHVVDAEESCLWATLKLTGTGHYIFHPDYPLSGFGAGDELLCLQAFSSSLESDSLCYALVLAPRYLRDQEKQGPGGFLHYSRVGLIASIEKRLFEHVEPTSIKIA